MVALVGTVARRVPGMIRMVLILTLIQIAGMALVHSTIHPGARAGGLCVTCSVFAAMSIATSVAAWIYVLREP